MANYFFITLDTTGPQLNIYAPSYTVRSLPVEITIEADEELSASNRQIYTIDSKGQRNDIILTYEGNKFVGTISFNDYPLGITSIYAQVEDIVGNVSDIVRKDIMILDVQSIKVSAKDSALINITTCEMSRSIEAKDHSAFKIETDVLPSDIRTEEKVCKIRFTSRETP